MTDLRVAVAGAGGRMGRVLVRMVAEADGMVLAGALDRAGAPEIGRDAGVLAGIGEAGVTVSDDPLPVFAGIDALLDFTAPAASLANADLAAQARIVHVVGTTGFGPEADTRTST